VAICKIIEPLAVNKSACTNNYVTSTSQRHTLHSAPNVQLFLFWATFSLAEIVFGYFDTSDALETCIWIHWFDVNGYVSQHYFDTRRTIHQFR